MGNREEGERREESGRERKNSPVPTLKLLLNLNNIIEIKKQINNNSTILDPAQQLTLDAVVLPANAANQAITWTSSDTTYATVAPTSATAANVIGVRERERAEPRVVLFVAFFWKDAESLFSAPAVATTHLRGASLLQTRGRELEEEEKPLTFFLHYSLFFFNYDCNTRARPAAARRRSPSPPPTAASRRTLRSGST